MKNPSVFQKIIKSPLSPPCLSLNERFPIPFLQISEKTGVFTPSLSVSAYSLIISLIISLANCQNIVQIIIKVYLAFIRLGIQSTWPKVCLGLKSAWPKVALAFGRLAFSRLGIQSTWPSVTLAFGHLAFSRDIPRGKQTSLYSINQSVG